MGLVGIPPRFWFYHLPRPFLSTCFTHPYPLNLEDLSSEQLRSDLLPLWDGLPRHTRRTTLWSKTEKGNSIPQVVSPRLPAFANPPGFAPAQATPELEASFALVTDRIHYQSGQEELTAERVALEANLQQEYCDRELILHDELVELHFAHYMSQQARHEKHNKGALRTRFRALGHELHQHFAQ